MRRARDWQDPEEAHEARSAVARNYGATLYELARREGAVELYGELIEEVGALYRSEPDVRRFLETPGIALEQKKEAIRRSLGQRAPEVFVRFVLVVLEKRRHRALPEIAAAYGALVDEAAGRVHATITLPSAADEALREEIVAGLRGVLDREVVAHFREDPRILGGVVVRMGDRLMDGSLRRRLEDLRTEMLTRTDGRRAAGGAEGPAAGAPATEHTEEDEGARDGQL